MRDETARPGIGRVQRLQVLRSVPMGLILGHPESEVLLPTRNVPANAAIGDWLEVFVHGDSEDRPIATTERPIAQVGEFARLVVVSVGAHGAFLDWGLAKDLLLPFPLQRERVRPGESVVVRVLLDEVSGRPIATAKLERFLEDPPADLREGQAVELLLYEETDLGTKAIVDGRFGGLLYFEPGREAPAVGAFETGYVQRIRKDGKVDLTLTPTGRAAVENARDVVLEALARSGGRLGLSDASPPEAIRRTLGLSKKAFKRAIGALYRERRIRIGEDSIESVGPLGSPRGERD